MGGALGSQVAEAKLKKMELRDFAPQASMRDVVKNGKLIWESGFTVRRHALAPESLRRFEQVAQRGGAELDMAAVVLSYEWEPL